MTKIKIASAALLALSGAATALTLSAGPASAAPAPAFAGFSSDNSTLVFRSTGDVDNVLTVNTRGASSPGSETSDRIIWTFTDTHPLTTSGDYCSHPDKKANVVECYRDYGTEGTTGDLPLRIHLGAGDDRALVDSTYTFDDRVYGEAGNDRIRTKNFVGLVDGGAGNDTLLGVRTKVAYNEPLQVNGGAGNDVIDYYKSTYGLGIAGGTGNDRIRGGLGNDKIVGNSGNDRVVAGKGNDYVSGGAGNDTLYGNSGNDRLIGGAGTDKIYGGAGKNSITS